mgnify:CR=1 FL=1
MPRRTAQRDAVTQAVVTAPGPLTPDEVLARAQADAPGLGIATVYRTLKLLVDAGRAVTVVLPDGQTRYEAADLGHHHHFRCRVCARVFDLPGCGVVGHGAGRPPEALRGFEVEGHELTYHGRCPACVAAARA